MIVFNRSDPAVLQKRPRNQLRNSQQRDVSERDRLDTGRLIRFSHVAIFTDRSMKRRVIRGTETLHHCMLASLQRAERRRRRDGKNTSAHSGCRAEIELRLGDGCICLSAVETQGQDIDCHD